jgi:hypothetical protein
MRSNEARQAVYEFVRDNLHDPKGRPAINKKWIYPDNPKLEELKKPSYPRISIMYRGDNGDFTGYHSPGKNLTWARERATFRVYALPEDKVTYSGTYEDGIFKDAALRDRIASELKSILENKINLLKQKGVNIRRNTINGPTDSDLVDNGSNTTHYISEITCIINYANVEDAS